MKANVLLFAIIACATGAEPPIDTVRLSGHLESLRGKAQLSADESRRLQSQYLDWIDARVKAGRSAADMNSELQSAGLILDWPDSVDEYSKSHAGYLGSISTRSVRASDDTLALEVGIYEGTGCSLDVTAVIYQRTPVACLASWNAAPGEHAFYLSGLDVGAKAADGTRLVASGWVASNCTSNWNGKRIRVDRLSDSSFTNVLTRDLKAKDRYEAESVAAWIRQDEVTFWYESGIHDGDLLSTAAIARYRIAERSRGAADAPRSHPGRVHTRVVGDSRCRRSALEPSGRN